jgi:ATP-dependent Clp endopeptidase proteolytic subunit ClpP
MNKFYNFAKSEGDTAELRIYGNIGESFWSEDSVTAARFAKELDEVKTPKLNIRINSLGGSVFDGIAIHSLLKAHKSEKTVYIDGIAASIASGVAMSGNKVKMPANAMMMIHDPWTLAAGNSSELRKNAAVLDKIKESLTQTYTAKTGMTVEDIGVLMTDETWMTAEDALSYGFIDEIIENISEENLNLAVANLEKEKFKNVPGDVMARVQPKKAEQAIVTDILNIEGDHMNITKEFLAKEHPEIVKQLTIDAVAAERERIKGVLDQSCPGHEALVNSLAFDGVSSPGDAAIKVLAQDKLKRVNMLSDIIGGAPVAVANVPSDGQNAPQNKAINGTVEEKARAAWDADNKLQKQYSSFEAFLNWEKAKNKKGFTKVHSKSV